MTTATYQIPTLHDARMRPEPARSTREYPNLAVDKQAYPRPVLTRQGDTTALIRAYRGSYSDSSWNHAGGYN